MIGAVVVHFSEDGEQSYYVYGDASVRLFIVDDRCPNDRVYEWLPREEPTSLKDMLRDDQIGSSADARHEAVKNRILSAERGEPHLKPA